MGSIDTTQENLMGHREPLAIIGMASKLPGDAVNIEEMWKMLLHGRCGASPFPEDRFNADAFYHPDPNHGGTFSVKGGHFLSEDPSYFDSAFFSATKEELMAMDPQQRLVMESVFHALENSGIPMAQIASSKCAVFASGWNHEHESLLNMDPEWMFKYKPTGTSTSILSNRVSWFFDLHGPSITVDTACSSSLVALHLAAQSIHCNESQMAIVTGVNLLEVPSEVIGMSHHGLLSPEGRCFSFDHRANGYSRGEGVGTVIMKPLRKAIRDGDTIRAIIRGTGVNQDGKTKGITLPNSDAQVDLIREVYHNAGLGFEDTMFVEAHGTGTAVGDPLEASALAEVFGPTRGEIPLYVGASKSNFGHLEGGAGIVGLVKAVLMLEKAIIPPNANFETLNPQIPAKKWNMKFPTECEPWPTKGIRRISINSFGFGGTNSHCILDDAYHFLKNHNLFAAHSTVVDVPRQEEVSNLTTVVSNIDPGLDTGSYRQEPFEDEGSTDSSGYQLIFPFSAFDKEGISRNTSRLGKYLEDFQGPFPAALLRDLSLTLTEKRTHFPWKTFVLASSISELTKCLLSNSFGIPPLRFSEVPRIAFVFTGQGAQYESMGQALMNYPVFRDSIEKASGYMTKLWSSWSLIDELFQDKKSSRVTSPEIAHPSCVALQVALVDLLNSWGVFPARVVGHSSGEIPAAYAAGKLSRQAAWTAGYYRGQVSASIKRPGAMIAVGLGKEELFPYLERVRANSEGELRIACYNSPKNSTVSGDEELVDALKSSLDEVSVFSRKLNVKNAYHSSHMEEVADEYARLMGELPEGHMVPYDAPMFSTVTGKRVESDRLDAKYWADNLVSPVRFHEALSELCLHLQSHATVSTTNVSVSKRKDVMVDQLIEIGPHSALKSAVSDILASEEIQDMIGYLPTLDRNNRSSEVLLHSTGTLFANGYQLNLHRVNNSSGSLQGKAAMLTNLPTYQFNHAEQTIYRGRLSTNLRFRPKARQDLIGAPVLDWSPQNPRWRHFLRIQENPWIRDHAVTGSFIYPGVGHLVMAIEGAKQMASPAENTKISGFRLKNIAIKRALVVPDTQVGVETYLAMTPVSDTAFSSSSIWNRFQISSYDTVGEEWIEHCTGFISLEYSRRETEGSDPSQHTVLEKDSEEWDRDLLHARESCKTTLDIAKCYDDFSSKGLKFGPLFRNLSEVFTTGQKLGAAFGRVIVPDIANEMPYNYLRPHVMHPTTMDSMLHLFLASILDYTGKDSIEVPYIPTFIRDVWLSADVSSEVGYPYQVHGTVSRVAYEKFECDLKVWDGANDECRIQMNGIRLAPLESASEKSDPADRQICHRMEWRPDVNFLTTANAQTLTTTLPFQHIDAERAWMENFQLASILMVYDSFAKLERADFSSNQLPEHLRKYYEWLCHLREEAQANRTTQISLTRLQSVVENEDQKSQLYREVAGHSAAGALAVRMGSQIPLVLQGEVDPMQEMFAKDKILTQVYDETLEGGNLLEHLKTYLSLLKHNKSPLKILEIGAGTGSSTRPILEELCRTDDNSRSPDSPAVISEYMFTDISTGFFETAKDRFQKWSGFLKFKKLDIEKDPGDQGFDLYQYDLIVAGNVVHATQNVRDTLRNLRRLAIPGGKILMHEIVRKDLLWTPLAFGLLPGWWLSTEHNRKLGPTMLTSEWSDALQDSGFSGVDIEFPSSSHSDLNLQSILVSTARNEPGTSKAVEVRLIIPSSLRDSELVSDVQKELQNQGFECSSMSLGEKVCPTTTYVSLLELHQPLLADVQQSEYLHLRSLLSTCKSLLWTTGDAEEHPKMNATIGLVRTLRSEREVDDVNFTTLAIADPNYSNQTLADALSSLLRRQENESVGSDTNSEYLLRNGMVHTNRLFDAVDPDNFLRSASGKSEPLPTSLNKSNRPIKLSIATPGLLQTLQWITDDGQGAPLEETMVEVDIKAIGLNFRDVMIAMGEYAACEFGGEAAGIVTRVGNKVTRFKAGDRVAYLGGVGAGCFQTYGRSDHTFMVHLPDNLDFSVAAGIPCVWATVLYGLQEIARLSPKDTILIHAAAGGVGQAAIQYAKLVGATIYATVSTPEKRQVLVSDYGIPEDHIFSSRDLTFAKHLMRATGGRGVDVILNSLSGEALKRSWECIAPLGRFIEIGRKDAQDFGHLELNPFLRNVTLASVQLPTVMRQDPSSITRLLDDAMRLFAQGKIHGAKPTTVMNYSEVEKALRLLQSGSGKGKIVLCPRENDIVPIVPDIPPPHRFNSAASYVLAGGLGGIGRSIAHWMATNGAKHLVFLSRSSHSQSETVKTFLDDLQQLGCQAMVIPCDISNKDSMQHAFASLVGSCPPIKGCIQFAMVLKDSLFENMEFTDWEAAIKPKIHGSWNLHENLPADVDFFIMFSSALGVMGAKSVANYAAGGTFQDALARHRVSRGLPATSLDLGPVLSIGFVAENLDYSQRTLAGLEPLREDEVHSLLQYVLTTSKKDISESSKRDCQLVAGLSSEAMYIDRGVSVPSFMQSPLFTHLRKSDVSRSDEAQAGPSSDVRKLLQLSKTLDEAISTISEGMRNKLSSLIATPVENIELSKSISSNGVDSLVATEFRTWLVKHLSADIPLLDITGTGSILGLSEKVAHSTTLVDFSRSAK